MNTPTIDLYRGDCLETLRNLPDNSVDSIVTDPPYGLSNTDPAKVQKALTAWVMGARDYVPEGKGFMGQKWDEFVPPPAVWDECYRVLKPGGHMAVFAGSRTQDLMGMSIRLAGFDIRDSVAWLYGSGFPKSLDVSKAIDKAARGHPQGAADPTSPNHGKYRTSKTEGKRWNGDSGQSYGAGGSAFLADTASGKTTANDTSTTAETSAVAAESDPKNTPAVIATDEAKKWEGWGTALKPGHEPIILARKPFPGTVAANVQEHGTGALNIDATRIGTTDDRSRPPRTPNTIYGNGKGTNNTASESNPDGRWPANVILDEDQATALDKQSGTKKSGSRKAGTYRGLGYQGSDATEYPEVKGDSGGASRFFYVAKAGKKERPSYLANTCNCETSPRSSTTSECENCGAPKEKIQHSTVKPVALMRWLVRLITPPGGTILEPFAGSGTTGEAAALEGFACIMIERHEPYLPLIRARMDAVVERIK